MDEWDRQQLRPWLSARVELPVGPLFCIIDGPTCGRPPPLPAAAFPTSSPPSNSPERAFR